MYSLGRIFYLVIFLHSVVLISCVSTSDKRASGEEISRANVNLATEYFRLNRIENALEIAKKALAADSQSVSAMILLALIYQQLEEQELAREMFEDALELSQRDSSEYSNLHNNYAVFLCKTGESAVAEEHFILAAENKLYTTPYKAYQNAALCMLNQNNQVKAEKYFRQALSIEPGLSVSLRSMAKLQLTNKKYMSARAYIQRYHALVQVNENSLLLAIKIEDKLGNRDEVARLKLSFQKQFPASSETFAFE